MQLTIFGSGSNLSRVELEPLVQSSVFIALFCRTSLHYAWRANLLTMHSLERLRGNDYPTAHVLGIIMDTGRRHCCFL